VEKLSAKLSNEMNKMKSQKKSITHAVENFLLTEYQLLDEPFISKFKLPELDYLALTVTANTNLDHIVQRIFNPTVEIGRPSFNKALNHIDRSFNKFFKNLSSNNVSVLMFPLESLFITLSKLKWNKTLKCAKIQKISHICYIISKIEKHSFFEKEEDTEKVNNDQKRQNLENLCEIYNELFKEFRKTNS
jgi:hypothetical protein